MIIWVIGVIAVLLLVGLLLYWQLAIAEGAYLGRQVVRLLYDWFAPRYDRVKQFDLVSDTVMLAVPITQHLLRISQVKDTVESLVLDVATGTGRLPQVLLPMGGFHGHIVALDISSRMLALAQAKLTGYADRVTWLHCDCQVLPFEDNHFDTVTCLEATEFLPQPRSAVQEMVRVLKPGGLLIISNRIGPDAWKMPGRTSPTKQFADWLGRQGLHNIITGSWLVDYDLIRAIKMPVPRSNDV